MGLVFAGGVFRGNNGHPIIVSARSSPPSTSVVRLYWFIILVAEYWSPAWSLEEQLSQHEFDSGVALPA